MESVLFLNEVVMLTGVSFVQTLSHDRFNLYTQVVTLWLILFQMCLIAQKHYFVYRIIQNVSE